MEFWNSLLTEESWRLLQEFRKKYNFILIGGWAVYLWIKRQKSKDIDIVVDIGELQKLKYENIGKNDSLKKYEIKKDNIDIDIYVEHYSKLAIPVEDINLYKESVEGFDVVCPEVLLILKQGAEINRSGSVKGEKDKVDIMSLLFFYDIDYEKYRNILEKYKLGNYVEILISLVRNFREYHDMDLNPRVFKLKKEKILNELKRI